MDEDVVQPSAIQKNRLHQTMCILNWSIQGNNAQVSNTAMQCLRRFFVYLVAPTRKWRSGWVPSTHGADDWRAQSIHIYIQYPKYTHCKHHRCNSKKSINLSTVNFSTTPSAPEGPLPSWAIPCPSDPFGSRRCLCRTADHRMGVHRLGKQWEMSQASRLDALGAQLSCLALGGKRNDVGNMWHMWL